MSIEGINRNNIQKMTDVPYKKVGITKNKVGI